MYHLFGTRNRPYKIIKKILGIELGLTGEVTELGEKLKGQRVTCGRVKQGRSRTGDPSPRWSGQCTNIFKDSDHTQIFTHIHNRGEPRTHCTHIKLN